ncbi:hypothetical protein, partial [Geminocystis sp. GBBB08]|uniref:hypothetical protein n=1 Tax=Geminocystis sp. GBBB08 TaxID=2604140 RepID=UPI0027E370A8
LGIVVFSGLSLATLLTLFLIPCLYLLLHQPLSFSTEEVTFINLKNISDTYSEGKKIISK